jgi:hypothetical protein
MVGIEGLVALVLVGPLSAGPGRGVRTSDSPVEVGQGTVGADALLDAMSAPSRPAMSKEDAARFDAWLAALRSGDADAVTAARKAFADAYFDADNRVHARTLELIALATALRAHAAKLAKQAAVTARFRQRRDRLTAYAATLEKALHEARETGKPVTVASSPGKAKSMTRAELEEQLAITRRNAQQMSQSFNMQYLALQQQMQSENRKLTQISNIVRTTQDAAKR